MFLNSGKDARVVAFVALKHRQKLTEEEVIKSCRGSLAAFKAPQCVRFFETLPKTATGKLEKVTLRNILEKEFGKAY